MHYSSELLLEMYRRMQCIRQFEDAAVEMHKAGRIPGPLHTSHGQEGEITGSCMALRPTDYMVGNHRSHGHPIAKGADLRKLMAELFAKKTGVCGGKGGSMHLADFSVGSLGETSIVGNGLPLAAGAALGAIMQNSDRLSLCFFGDGASSQGTFHETCNIASLWKLPLILVCENNGYGQLTRTKNAVSIENIADRAASYSMPGIIVDGQDVLAVYDAVSRAAQLARSGGGPTLIEAKTYRYLDHAANMGRTFGYRTSVEIETWKQQDPLILFKNRLLQNFGFDDQDFSGIDASVKKEVETAILFASESAFPEIEDAFKDVFVDTEIQVR